jgi:hypothetical protein
MIRVKYSVALAILTFLLACGGGAPSEDRSASDRDEPNILKEYVNTPKDKARSAGRDLEDAQERARKQAQELMED